VTLKTELPAALRRLHHENIAPVDLAQSAIGPGMAIFSRFAKVIEPDGSAMSVRSALGLINAALDQIVAEQEGEFDPDTRWAITWFEQHGMGEGRFGDAETLSKAKDTAVGGLERAGIIKSGGGRVRLLRREELADGWSPATDRRPTVWEAAQHMVRALDREGEAGAGDLSSRIGGYGELARDLAYRLYLICERKAWADEALAYNQLVVAWPEIERFAHAARSGERQQTLSL
jgi:putative DNA methylase